MLARFSLNYKKTDNAHTHRDSDNNQKQNNQKNLNRGKKTSGLGQLDPCLMVKPLEKKGHLTKKNNTKLNLSLSHASNQPAVESKGKVSSRNSLQRDKVQQKRQSNTQQFCQLYGKDIIAQHQLKPTQKPAFLSNHQITPLLRARMLDWMVEVMKSYKFGNKTYFAAVELLDRYFIESQENIPLSQLHIAGVTVMYIATKMDEIYPLRIKTVYEKIVHKKIQKEALIDMQTKIFGALGHKVNSWTFFDLTLLKIADQYQGQDIQVIQKIQQVLSFISKCIVYDYDLYIRYDMETFAKVLLRLASNIFNLSTEKQTYSLSCYQEVVKSFKGLKTTFKGLGNIFKFTDEKSMNLVQSYFSQK